MCAIWRTSEFPGVAVLLCRKGPPDVSSPAAVPDMHAPQVNMRTLQVKKHACTKMIEMLPSCNALLRSSSPCSCPHNGHDNPASSTVQQHCLSCCTQGRQGLRYLLHPCRAAALQCRCCLATLQGLVPCLARLWMPSAGELTAGAEQSPQMQGTSPEVTACSHRGKTQPRSAAHSTAST